MSVWLPISVPARVGVIYKDDIFVIYDFVEEAVYPLTPAIVAVPSRFQVSYPCASPGRY